MDGFARPVGGLDFSAETGLLRMNGDERGFVPDRNADDLPEPEQIFIPEFRRDEIQILPSLFAEARLVPGLIGQGRHTEIRARVVLRRSQRAHPGERDPRPLSTIGRPVDDSDVIDLIPHQRVGDGDAALPGTDDQDIMNR